LAAAINGEFGVEAELVKGDNGIFDVEVDGRRIFSKHEAGRFPDTDEVLALLRR
jgi:selT/selW/selH-like putative selenoprotein